MKTILKITLIGCVVLFLFIFVLSFVIYNWLYSAANKPQVTAVIEHARAFGKTTDNQGCIDEGLRRAEKLRAASPTSVEFWAESAWAGNCLETSEPTPDFCKGVPTMSEEFRNALNENVYEEQMCKKTKFGQYDIHCKSVYSSKQKFCW